MKNEEISNEIKEIKRDLSSLQESVAKMAGEHRALPLVFRWVAFPLIMILGAVYGVSII